MRLFTVLSALLWLAACGVDGPPVPPGQENPETIRSVDEINTGGYF